MNKNDMDDWFKLISRSLPGVEVDLQVLSGSMDPYLPSGKIAVIRTISAGEIDGLHRGSIIVYRNKFRLTAHRLLLRLHFIKYIYEKGDRNRFGSFVRYDSVSGVVLSVKDENGVLRDFCSDEQIRIAKREVWRNLYRLITDAVLIMPRRVKSVLAKK